jgi:hypothetical protein
MEWLFIGIFMGMMGCCGSGDKKQTQVRYKPTNAIAIIKTWGDEHGRYFVEYSTPEGPQTSGYWNSNKNLIDAGAWKIRDGALVFEGFKTGQLILNQYIYPTVIA